VPIPTRIATPRESGHPQNLFRSKETNQPWRKRKRPAVFAAGRCAYRRRTSDSIFLVTLLQNSMRCRWHGARGGGRNAKQTSLPLFRSCSGGGMSRDSCTWALMLRSAPLFSLRQNARDERARIYGVGLPFHPAASPELLRMDLPGSSIGIDDFNTRTLACEDTRCQRESALRGVSTTSHNEERRPPLHAGTFSCVTPARGRDASTHRGADHFIMIILSVFSNPGAVIR
jgi:hypothetical protein